MNETQVRSRRGRVALLLTMTTALLLALAGTASAATTGEPLHAGQTGERQALRIVTIVQKNTARFLDAHQAGDFNVVTRLFQNNDTQRWLLTDKGGGTFTIQQVSSGRFLDAYQSDNQDFRVVTRPPQDNNTQLWRLRDLGGSFFTIQQVSSARLLDAHENESLDFQAVTRPPQNNDSQLWQIIDV